MGLITVIKKAKTKEGKGEAEFSTDEKHRYYLSRDWSNGEKKKIISFVGLNPSTATEEKLDNTVRRCYNFAKMWGYNKMFMLNIFGFRSTDPKGLKKTEDPVGPLNDDRLKKICKKSDLVIACWGTHGGFLDRGNHVINLLENLHYLRLSKGGFPWHPLYLPNKVRPIPLIKKQDG